MGDENKTRTVLMALFGVAVVLALAFWSEMWGKPAPVRELPLVAAEFLGTATWRQSYADLLKANADVDAYDCYLCHDKDKKQTLTYDAKGQLVVPREHSDDIVMGHGTHGRNNNCFNCHNDEDLTQLQSRDGRKLKLEDSVQLCGSCHGPTYRDWEYGSHGRTSGYWDRSKGPFEKKICVNCHDPHSPKFPGRKPAPPPNHLRDKPGEKVIASINP